MFKKQKKFLISFDIEQLIYGRSHFGVLTQRKYNFFLVLGCVNRRIFLVPEGAKYVIDLIYLAQD